MPVQEAEERSESETDMLQTSREGPQSKSLKRTAARADNVVAGITIMNGQGASIAMVGPSVIINNGALTIT